MFLTCCPMHCNFLQPMRNHSNHFHNNFALKQHTNAATDHINRGEAPIQNMGSSILIYKHLKHDVRAHTHARAHTHTHTSHTTRCMCTLCTTKMKTGRQAAHNASATSFNMHNNTKACQQP